MSSYNELEECDPLQHRKTFVASIRIDVRTIADLIHLTTQQNIIIGGNLSELLGSILEQVAKQNKKKRFESTSEALRYLAINGFSIAQAYGGDARGRRLATQMQIEALNEENTPSKMAEEVARRLKEAGLRDE